MKAIPFMLILILTIPLIHALGEEAIQADKAIKDAKSCLDKMISKDIPVNRANESLNEAIQLYEAQLALEKRGGKSEYKLVTEFANETCQVQEISQKAKDELEVFLETYIESNKTINLSAMDGMYFEIINSFREERFEETISLIDDGYEKLSEIEASQTAFNLFYTTTTRTIRNFLIENWIKISAGFAITIILLMIFWKSLKILKIKLKIRALRIEKETLKGLIKNLQYNYFETKKVSETEFRVKLNKFKEMIRDVDRQIPLLKEEIEKINKKEKGKEQTIKKNMTTKKDENKERKKRGKKKARNKEKSKKQRKKRKRRIH